MAASFATIRTVSAPGVSVVAHPPSRQSASAITTYRMVHSCPAFTLPPPHTPSKGNLSDRLTVRPTRHPRLPPRTRAAGRPADPRHGRPGRHGADGAVRRAGGHRSDG